MTTNLTKSVRLYNKTGKGLDSIKQEIIMLAYSFPKQQRYCSEEDCADFLLSFYPRIDKVIHTYKTRGTSFEAYLRCCFIWHMKTFLQAKLQKNRQEQILYNENCQNLPAVEKLVWEVHEENPGPLIVPSAETTNQERRREWLKILLLTMKCADDINDTLIRRVASRLGTHSNIIFHIVEILRTTMRGRIRRIEYLKERRWRGYFRVRVLMDMRKHCRDKFRAEDLDKKIIKEKKRLASICRVLAVTPKGPSHTDIARILGMPKGTIDSGLFYIRGKIKKQARL